MQSLLYVWKWIAGLPAPEPVQASPVDGLPFPTGDGGANPGIHLHGSFGDGSHMIQADEIRPVEAEEAAAHQGVFPCLDAFRLSRSPTGGVEYGGVAEALQVGNLRQGHPAADVSGLYQNLRLLPGRRDCARARQRKSSSSFTGFMR